MSSSWRGELTIRSWELEERADLWLSRSKQKKFNRSTSLVDIRSFFVLFKHLFKYSPSLSASFISRFHERKKMSCNSHGMFSQQTYFDSWPNTNVKVNLSECSAVTCVLKKN